MFKKIFIFLSIFSYVIHRTPFVLVFQKKNLKLFSLFDPMKIYTQTTPLPMVTSSDPQDHDLN